MQPAEPARELHDEVLCVAARIINKLDATPFVDRRALRPVPCVNLAQLVVRRRGPQGQDRRVYFGEDVRPTLTWPHSGMVVYCAD